MVWKNNYIFLSPPTTIKELGDLIKKRSKLELQIQDMKSEIESNDQSKKEKKKKIEDINADIAKTQAKLDDITPKVSSDAYVKRRCDQLIMS